MDVTITAVKFVCVAVGCILHLQSGAHGAGGDAPALFLVTVLSLFTNSQS
jgi:hypothetical protein